MLLCIYQNKLRAPGQGPGPVPQGPRKWQRKKEDRNEPTR